MFTPCRVGTETYFRVGIENVISRAGVDCLLVRCKEECHYPVFLADSENATLQLSDYLFPCLSACVNLGSKLSLGLTQVLLESGFFGICGGQEEFRASFHKKSIMLPGRCQVLDMCGLIPG